ncbi:hypothetical protein RFI_01502 [Reticulomyxa filosa]|uniref:Uncharacterized protein n=1 Tax=Reticulomyxa filosa TaxID=46433 RepID=X6PAK0_RETFI|nr:hypothetical protein RFI_01502 [Reticulomyxa filosa]|eukprot:ETO35560.1 hypothetical protein RFI_01502 [Reticulomyxa filosa]
MILYRTKQIKTFKKNWLVQNVAETIEDKQFKGYAFGKHKIFSKFQLNKILIEISKELWKQFELECEKIDKETCTNLIKSILERIKVLYQMVIFTIKRKQISNNNDNNVVILLMHNGVMMTTIFQISF